VVLNYDIFSAKLPKVQTANKRELNRHRGERVNESKHGQIVRDRSGNERSWKNQREGEDEM
jgi:hypothetical protein